MAAGYLVVTLVKKRFREEKWFCGLMFLCMVYIGIFYQHARTHEFFLVYLALPVSIGFAVSTYKLLDRDNPFLVRSLGGLLILLGAGCCIFQDYVHHDKYFRHVNRYLEWDYISRNRRPAYFMIKDRYYLIVSLVDKSVAEVERFIAEEKARKKRRDLLIGIRRPGAAETPDDRARSEAIEAIMERECEYLAFNARHLLYGLQK
jgi:hypothetical protein